MRDILEKLVLEDKIPILGICVGMQIMAESSQEGILEGLKCVPGKVLRFKSDNELPINIPHMGWNQVQFTRQNPIFSGIPEDSFFYFVHSYYVDPFDDDIVLGETEYGLTFCSAIAKDNIVATQFHPEISGEIGLGLYKNFLANI